jgi:hypothetical protein
LADSLMARFTDFEQPARGCDHVATLQAFRGGAGRFRR